MDLCVGGSPGGSHLLPGVFVVNIPFGEECLAVGVFENAPVNDGAFLGGGRAGRVGCEPAAAPRRAGGEDSRWVGPAAVSGAGRCLRGDGSHGRLSAGEVEFLFGHRL